MHYRKIWEKANGPIPLDELGKTYEIHHIDGNRQNNSIDNLICLSIQEHYDLHYKQKDWKACYQIRRRLNLSIEALNDLNSKLSENMKGKPSITKGMVYTKVPCKYCYKSIGHAGNLIKHEKSCKLNPNREVIKNEKTAAANRGKKRSEEIRKKISDAKTGISISEEHKKKLSSSMINKPWTINRILAQKNKKQI